MTNKERETRRIAVGALGADRVLDAPRNEADALILAEIQRRLDWLNTSSEACASQVLDMMAKGLIQGFRFQTLELKINGAWYKRP